MESKKQYKHLHFQGYFHLIANRKRYSDFNTLGLFRSILENEHLDLQERKQLREHVKDIFGKTYEFLLVKDPWTWVKLEHLGETYSDEQWRDIWGGVRRMQAQILKAKGIRHRNFGTYSKHNCGHDDCRYKGLMVKPDWALAHPMWLESDHRDYQRKQKSDRLAREMRDVRDRVRDLEVESLEESEISSGD